VSLRSVLFFLVFCFSLNIPVLAAAEAAANPSKQAISLYKQGERKKAELLLVNFIQKSNDKTSKAFLYQSHQTLAEIHGANGNHAKQKEVLTALLSKLDKWGYKGKVDYITVTRLLAQNAIHTDGEAFALAYYESALEMAKKLYPDDSVKLLDIIFPLARLKINRLESQSAEQLLAEATVIQETYAASGKDKDGSTKLRAKIIQLQGELYFRQGKTNKAAEQYRQALALREATLGSEHIATAQTVIALAGALKGIGYYSESEELYYQGYAIYESKVGSEHTFIATILNNLGQLYYLQGRFEESEKVLKRSLGIKIKHYNKQHFSTAETYSHLGYLYFLLEQYDQARANFSKAIAIWSSAEMNRPRYKASAETWVAVILHRQGKSKEAIKKLYAVLNVLKKIYGEHNVATSQAYQELADILFALKRYQEAEQYYQNSIKASSQFGTGDWKQEIKSHSLLARFYLQQTQKDKALAQSRKAIDGLKLRVKRNSGKRAQSLNSELKTLRQVSMTHIDILYDLYQSNQSQKLLNESFTTAQLSRSTSTARALANMSARFAAGSDELAQKIKDYQDLLDQWQDVDSMLSSALAKSTDKRNLEEEKQLRSYAIKIKGQLERLGKVIRENFPDYDNLVGLTPISIAQVQSVLKSKEALLVYLLGDKHSYLWMIKTEQAALYKLDVTQAQIKQTVQSLRKHLVPRYLEVTDLNKMAPFPVKKGHQFFKQILQPAYTSLADVNNLIIVADGALQSLPLSILVTKPPVKIKTPIEHRKIDWLIKEKTLLVLPAVNSLNLQRQISAKRSINNGQKNFVGFGDPALKHTAEKIKRFRQSQSGTQAVQMRGISSLRSIIGKSRAVADIDFLSEMPELPDTATELIKISSILKGNKQDIYLRSQATEKQLFSLDLSGYKTVQFATHGLMSGDFEGLFEPALVMTPSIQDFNSDNDGLLTASEITQLNLNANMVVLSACNTAASDGTPGAEGMSGLAKAFFYAGGESIMATHWEVLSDATVYFTTQLFSYNTDKKLTKAESHKLATIDLMNHKKTTFYAHPLIWAPFSLIGVK
jgi:CHAT domain-containing protein